ncbi:MAG: DNA polymerase IV [Dehalococcoidia bacterium]
MRFIVHADLDAFYASVEQMDNPQLRGKPVLVGGRPENRGVVAACSYEAREFGVHSAIPMRTALQRCPSAAVIQPRFGRYHHISAKVMDIFRSVAPLVEPVSLDEAYLDITSVVTKDLPPLEVARYIKQQVREEVGLAISVGVASSKSVAKIASGLSKPDGLEVVEPGTEEEFLAPLPVDKLWGIGPVTEGKLKKHGIHTLGILASQPNEWLRSQFGKRGLEMKKWSVGYDDRPVEIERVAKSMSAEVTFSRDIDALGMIKSEVWKLSLRVSRRLKEDGVRGRTVTVKLRLSDFTTLTRSATSNRAVQKPGELRDIAMDIITREMVPGRAFRLIGIAVSNFVEVEQLRLFD